MTAVVSTELYLEMTRQSQARFSSTLESLSAMYRNHLRKAGLSESAIDRWIEKLYEHPDPIGYLTSRARA